MVLLRLATAYSSSLMHAPIPTKALTAALVGLTGDALAQGADADVTRYQQGRGLTFALFGAAYTGAFQHHLFSWLQTNCHGSILACLDISTWLDAHWLAAAEATLLNQFVFIPLLYLPLFYLINGLTRGMRLRAIVRDASRKYLNVLRANHVFWIPVQCALFALLAPELLVPVTCLAGVAWNFILSTLSSRRTSAVAVPVAALASEPSPIIEQVSDAVQP